MLICYYFVDIMFSMNIVKAYCVNFALLISSKYQVEFGLNRLKVSFVSIWWKFGGDEAA